MISGIIALMTISLVVLSFSYLRPVRFEENVQPVYSFIDKIEQKQQTLRFIADQAVTEAIWDATETGTQTVCDPSEISIEEIQAKLIELGNYFQKINDQPENKDCTVSLISLALPSSPPPPQSPYDVNTTIRIECVAEKKDSQNNSVEYARIKKIHSMIKQYNASWNDPICEVTVIDKDSGIIFPTPA